MVLGTKELLRLVKEQKLVENLCERELKNPEGTGFDLRLGAVYQIVGDKAFLGEEERFSPKVEKVVEYEEGKKKSFVLKPGEQVLVETIEKINTPNNLVAIFRPRTSLYRSGATLYTATCSPGYCGTLTFSLHNFSKVNFEIELGARIVHVLFFPVEGEIERSYEGQWQGGRISSQGVKERQV